MLGYREALSGRLRPRSALRPRFLGIPFARAMDRPLSSHNGMRRASGPCNARARRPVAFTLLEVLTVIALVGLLVAIAFTATGGATERARRARCRSELAVLAQALEAYRIIFGDYPRTGAAANDPAGVAATDDGPGILFNALAGRRGPGATLVPVETRSTVTLSAFALQSGDLPSVGSTAQSANAFLDPWGRRYLYFHKTGPAWTARVPLLFSVGPDGVAELPADPAAWDGTLPSGAANADNLHAFRS